MTDGTASAWIYYVDESYDNNVFCLCALGLKMSTWRAAFDAVKAYRARLRESDGVLIGTEIHARDLTRGRGKLGAKEIGKWRRSRIFAELLQLTAALPDAHLFNVCLESKGRRDPELDAWDRLLNRLNRMCEQRNKQENAIRRTLLNAIADHSPVKVRTEIERRLIPYSAHTLVIADKGREHEIVSLKRKLTVINYLPSRFGSWGGASRKNIPLAHFVEDVFFVDSAHSFLIQLVDCSAFALLKRETPPTPQILKYDLHRAFDVHLKGICVRQASRNDPDGVVRK